MPAGDTGDERSIIGGNLLCKAREQGTVYFSLDLLVPDPQAIFEQPWSVSGALQLSRIGKYGLSCVLLRGLLGLSSAPGYSHSKLTSSRLLLINSLPTLYLGLALISASW